jgi:hypothetical protein
MNTAMADFLDELSGVFKKHADVFRHLPSEQVAANSEPAAANPQVSPQAKKKAKKVKDPNAPK